MRTAILPTLAILALCLAGPAPAQELDEGVAAPETRAALEAQVQRVQARIETKLQRSVARRIEADIQQLAAAYPDVLTFDARLGMIRFASDFTFDLGSVALTGDAESTIVALARILVTDAAADFEARVVGHTDDVPIGRPDTRQRHPTNLHLSVHRAISVRDALVDAGVQPVRIQVAGYGEFRPLASNDTPDGRALNRRVDIVLLSEEAAAAEAR